MAVDKLVDSSKLNAALDYEASKIIAKGGGTAPLAFDFANEKGFGDYIDAIPSGGSAPHEVPDGYTQLKWLKSSGTQAINTGVAPTLETQLQVQGFLLEGNGVYYPMAGCTNPVVALNAPSVFDKNGYYSFGNVSDKNFAQPWPSDAIPVYTINKTKAECTVEGFTATRSATLNATTMSGDSGTRIFLFARGKEAGAFERMSKCQMYRAKIWDNGTLIRDFVPAMRNSDEVLGMYDIVGNSFYTNAGTGVFTGGTYS